VYREITTASYVAVVLASLRVTEATGPKPGPSSAIAEAPEVAEPVAVFPGPVAGAGNLVRLPSTLIAPPVADVGIAKVWPEMTNGIPPGVRVVLATARRVGFPVKRIPLRVYTEESPAAPP